MKSLDKAYQTLMLEQLSPGVVVVTLNRPERSNAMTSTMFGEQEFLAGCLRVGRQWALQRRLASEESVSAEMFRTALKLARYRGLIESDDPTLGKRRRAFADELREARRHVAEIAGIASRQTHP